MNEITSIPIPVALKELIMSNNQLLKIHQQDLTNKVMIANEEMMKMLGLNPEEGWRLDLDTFTYVKINTTDAPSVG